ncbi:MAG TPA: hypothetical protein VI461_02475, partial [Chitinophagaceae bacterium]|nr:hypothetical protein [Chitinophagaceae bacterium]
NVNTELHVSITEAHQQIKAEMQELFKGFERDFHFFDLYNFPQAMNLFVNDHNIDMIITLPKDHNWLSTLTGGTATQKIAYQSTVPVLAIHQ